MTSKLPKGVSIHPSTFADEQLDLSTLSLEEVVARFKDVEKRRNAKTEPDDEAEVRWHIRSVPGELMSSVRVVAARLGVSRAILTRCMSRHQADWYSNALGLDALACEYDEIYGSIKQRAYSTLRYQAEHPAEFRFVGHVEDGDVSISTVKWVVGKLTELRELLGVDASDLFTLGLMWSLTRIENRAWDKEAIDRFFSPEVFNFETFVAERRIDVIALRTKYEHREAVRYNDHIFTKDGGTNVYTV